MKRYVIDASALKTQRSLSDCLYLAVAEVIDGTLVTADQKFYTALGQGSYARRVLWVGDLQERS